MSRIDVEPGVAAEEIDDPAVTICAVCPHPVESHDVIARRFCTATQAGMFNRGCVCPGGPEKAAPAMRVRK
jgi:hypothetical protein